MLKAYAMYDWFLPAVTTAGSVDAGLKAVVDAEEQRLLFAKCLRHSLCFANPSRLDRISQLKIDLASLKKTLDHRLGMLRVDMAGAWFRESFPSQLGPFSSEVSLAPMLPQIAPHLARKARNEIVNLWETRHASSDLLPHGGYLWSRLLSCNARWAAINQMTEPFADLRLDELPEALPDILATTSLNAYLKRVAEAMKVTRSELNVAFHDFFKSTEDFLLGYYRRPSSAARPEQRRQGAIADSLRFMNFTGTPSSRELKKRYFELAKKLHPDAAGGDSQRFQMLTSHYKRILKNLNN